MRLSVFSPSIAIAILSVFGVGTATVAQSISPTEQRAEPIPEQTVPAMSVNSALSDVSWSDPSSTPLKAGDRLQVTVVGFPELSGEQLVTSNGGIQLPMAGLIQVSGLTPPQAVAKITDALLPYVRYPQVGLSVVAFSPIRVSITGEVRHPGPRVMSAATASTQATSPIPTSSAMTLSEALTLAGGITPNADVQNILIRRTVHHHDDSGSSNPPAVARTEIPVDLWQAIQTGDLSADPRLQDGDEIIVPTIQVAHSYQRQLLASTIAPAQITVQVAGEVLNPGQIQVDPRSGVSEAVAAAGGPTDDANTRSIELLRMVDGRLERQTYDFGDASSPLLDGDVIVVSKSNSSSLLDSLGRIIPLLNPFLFLF
ncbi:SLBB domain-containing protein [Thermocoleostomius sinensis]|uniref:SLBB domain-containing protein n=1 Tax=Thermocoleostomius sinensis A174 TaxID=2016057 RepID=A0A9E8ZH10_9CYAN|nr:SLBB domain-containing protein [Thermocoleostomius sinensis]WAL62601.1 SLBB domain-containing protein [Thermocoleostomius sinensis A174]